MHLRVNHRVPLVAAMTAIVLLAVGFPASAYATKTVGTRAQIAAKQAQKDAIIAKLESLRADLQLRTDRLTTLSQDLSEAQGEVTQVTQQLAEVQTSLDSSKKALAARAAALYRGDRVSMLGLVLGAQSVEDLIVRTQYLLLIASRDASMLNDYRLTRSESVWLQDSLARRTERLRTLQTQALNEQNAVKNEMISAERDATSIDYDLAALLRPAPSTETSGSSVFDLDNLITDARFTSLEMTAGAVQDFLDQQDGALKDFRTSDINHQTKSAAQIIYDAAAANGVSPKVILITLQKEQSLLSDSTPSTRQLQWAMGAGKTDSTTKTYMSGFGRQVWYGARALHRNSLPWRAGITMNIDSSTVRPANGATYSLYKYTPHLHGTRSFWDLWRRYFNENPAQ